LNVALLLIVRGDVITKHLLYSFGTGVIGWRLWNDGEDDNERE